MCLYRITNARTRSKDNPIIAYKFFEVNKAGGIHGTIHDHTGKSLYDYFSGYTYKLEEVYTATGQLIYSMKSRDYKAGFHAYREKMKNKKYSTTFKVKLWGNITYGVEESWPNKYVKVVSAEFMEIIGEAV